MSTKIKITDKKIKNHLEQSTSLDPVSRVRVAGEGRDEYGNRYITIGIRKTDTVLGPYSMKELIKSKDRLFTDLTNAGVSFLSNTTQRELVDKLQNRKSDPDTFKVATGLGWYGSAFVLANEIVGKASTKLETAFGNLDPQMLSKYRTRGELHDWQQKIAKLCKGNSRLMFAISLALTGPILRFVTGPRSGGFQIWGDAEAGKTTAAMVAGSVWGCHRDDGKRERGFAETWHSTAGKIELTALAHNNTLLILDETKRAGRTDSERAQVVLDVTVGLAEHTERERLSNLGSARSWRLYFLSTSNYSLAGLAKRGNIFVDDAELGRLVDIPLPDKSYGLYEKLHGFVNGAALSNALKIRCRNYYGSAGNALVTHVVGDYASDPAKLKEWLNTKRQAYLTRLDKKAAGLSPLKRASDQFATVFAAGSLAIKYGILKWTRKQLLRAILCCQLDGLRYVEKDPSTAAISTLRATLVKYLYDSRGSFMRLAKQRPRYGRDDIDAAPGYREKHKGQHWFYLTSACLDKIIGRGARANDLKRMLVNEGMMDKPNRGHVVQRRIFKGGKGNQDYARVHAFKEELARELAIGSTRTEKRVQSTSVSV